MILYTYIYIYIYTHIPIYSGNPYYMHNQYNGMGYSFFVLGSRRHGMSISHIFPYHSFFTQNPVPTNRRLVRWVGFPSVRAKSNRFSFQVTVPGLTDFKAHLSTKDNESERSNKNAQNYLNENDEEANIIKKPSKQRHTRLYSRVPCFRQAATVRIRFGFGFLVGPFFVERHFVLKDSTLIFEVYGHASLFAGILSPWVLWPWWLRPCRKASWPSHVVPCLRGQRMRDNREGLVSKNL